MTTIDKYKTNKIIIGDLVCIDRRTGEFKKHRSNHKYCITCGHVFYRTNNEIKIKTISEIKTFYINK